MEKSWTSPGRPQEHLHLLIKSTGKTIFSPFPFVFRPTEETCPCSARKPARAGLCFVLLQAYLRFQTIITADILFPQSNGVMWGLGCCPSLPTHPGNAFCLQCLILLVPPSLCTLNLWYTPMELSTKLNEMQQRWIRNKWNIAIEKLETIS